MSKTPKKKKEPDYLEVLQRWVDAIRHDSDDPQAEAKRLCNSISKIVSYLGSTEVRHFEAWVLEEIPRLPAHGYTTKDVMDQTNRVVGIINAKGDAEDEVIAFDELAYTTEGHIYCDAQRLASMATFIHFCETEDAP